MELDRQLLKEFAKLTNDQNYKTSNYLRGTIVKNADDKYVQIDGSTVMTPISEIVDVDDGDRVLVSIENHKAIIVGNYSAPPSLKQTYEAYNKADNVEKIVLEVKGDVNYAKEAAEKAQTDSKTAIDNASIAISSADEAKSQSASALSLIEGVDSKISEAESKASSAVTLSNEAKKDAADAKKDAADANTELSNMKGEIASSKEDIEKMLSDFDEEISEKIVEEVKIIVESENTKAEFEKVVEDSVSKVKDELDVKYVSKTEHTEITGEINNKIEMNTKGIALQSSKTEELKSDTKKAQEYIVYALEKAGDANNKASAAMLASQLAKKSLEEANDDLIKATNNVQIAFNAHQAAKEAADKADKSLQHANSQLNEAMHNYELVSSDPESTKEMIDEAQRIVDAAQIIVDEAIISAAEAGYIYGKAEEELSRCNAEFETAQGIVSSASQKSELAEQAANDALAEAIRIQNEISNYTYRMESAESRLNLAEDGIKLESKMRTEFEDRVKENYAQLSVVDDMIKNMVVTKNNNGEESSLMTQTESGWKFDMSSILSDMNDFSNKLAYFTIGSENNLPFIELGASDSPFKVRITNADIQFMENGLKVAYISNKKLYITSGTTTKEFQIGTPDDPTNSSNYIWRVRPNGNLGLDYNN